MLLCIVTTIKAQTNSKYECSCLSILHIDIKSEDVNDVEVQYHAKRINYAMPEIVSDDYYKDKEYKYQICKMVWRGTGATTDIKKVEEEWPKETKLKSDTCKYLLFGEIGRDNDDKNNYRIRVKFKGVDKVNRNLNDLNVSAADSELLTEKEIKNHDELIKKMRGLIDRIILIDTAATPPTNNGTIKEPTDPLKGGKKKKDSFRIPKWVVITGEVVGSVGATVSGICFLDNYFAWEKYMVANNRFDIDRKYKTTCRRYWLSASGFAVGAAMTVCATIIIDKRKKENGGEIKKIKNQGGVKSISLSPNSITLKINF